MPLAATPSLVLQVFAYSDTSKVLRLLTRDHGLRSVIAKGARRPASRFGGILEPFTEGVAHFHLREGRDLHTLSGFDLLRSRQALGQRLAAFAGASVLAEVVLRSGTEEPAPELYDLVRASFDALAQVPDDRLEGEILTALWSAISLLGFRPETERCVSCARPLPPGEPSRFDVEGGGAACSACRPHGRPYDARSRGELQRMASRLPLAGPLHDPPLQRALLRVFLSTHLGQERPLRALPLLLQSLE